MNKNRKTNKLRLPKASKERSLLFFHGPGEGLRIELIRKTFSFVDPVTREQVTYNAIFAFAICLWSELIEGFYLELEGNVKRAIIGALCAAVEDKARLCGQLGLTCPSDWWPNSPLPEAVVCDPDQARDSDFGAAVSECINVKFIGESMLIPAALTRRYEMLATKVLAELKRFNSLAPKSGETVTETLLTLEDCYRLMAMVVIGHNNRLLTASAIPANYPAGAVPTPAGIFKWGLANRTGDLT